MPTKQKSDNSHFSISNTTKGKLPRLPFLEIKNRVLGESYELSLVVIGDTRSKKLNNTYRGKNNPTNVLSFPLSKTEGEIFLNLHKARKELKKFDEKFPNFVGFLFIHGLLHLKGMEHGATMERAEQKLRKEFSI